MIADVRRDDRVSRLGTAWWGLSDRVMSGLSQEAVRLNAIDGRRCLRSIGDVRLDNNGGFIQRTLDLAPHGATVDASRFAGLRFVVRGTGETYGAYLRTPDAVRPWQSSRASSRADAERREIRIPFSDVKPYWLFKPLDVTRLRRLGLVAIGRAFSADLAVAEIGLYV